MMKYLLLVGMIVLMALDDPRGRTARWMAEAVFFCAVFFWIYAMGGAEPLLARAVWMAGGMMVLSGVIARSWFKEYHLMPNFFFASQLLALFGFGNVLLARDWIELYVGLELVSWSMLFALWVRPRDSLLWDCAFKYLMIHAVGSLLLLLSACAIVLSTQSLLLPVDVPSSALVATAVLLWLWGACIKMGVAPTHLYMADIYEGSQPPLLGAFGVMTRLTWVLLAWRVRPIFYAHAELWMWLCAMCAVSTWVLGHFQALAHTRLARLMAYAGSAQMGWVLFAWSLGTDHGFRLAIAFLYVYALAWFVWITLMAHLSYQHRELRWMEELSGLMQAPRRAVLIVALITCIGVMMGVPPFAGFGVRFAMLMEAHSPFLLSVGAVGMLTHGVALLYYSKILYHAMMRMHYYEVTVLDLRGPYVALLLSVGLVALSYDPCYVGGWV